jgi:hypothetical protein
MVFEDSGRRLVVPEPSLFLELARKLERGEHLLVL